MKMLALMMPLVLAAGSAWVGGPVHPDGSEVHCDLPIDRHQRNAGGSDGAGLCVFTSIGMAADWCSEPGLIDFRDWMRSRPGGGYPAKVTAMIRALCRERQVAEPKYFQLQGGDLDVLAKAVQQGHLACVTYSLSPTGRYGGRPIAHMVNCVAARAGPQQLWAIVDNNHPGTIEWMTQEQFHQSYTHIGGGWSVILLKEGPPPVPWN